MVVFHCNKNNSILVNYIAWRTLEWIMLTRAVDNCGYFINDVKISTFSFRKRSFRSFFKLIVTMMSKNKPVFHLNLYIWPGFIVNPNQ